MLLCHLQQSTEGQRMVLKHVCIVITALVNNSETNNYQCITVTNCYSPLISQYF